MCHYTHVAIMESWVIGCLKTIAFISEASPKVSISQCNDGLYATVTISIYSPGFNIKDCPTAQGSMGDPRAS